MNDRGTMGPGVRDLKSIRLLNRLIIWKDATAFAPEDLTWEGDLRHVEILAKQLGLSTRSSLRSTVSDKNHLEEEASASRHGPGSRAGARL